MAWNPSNEVAAVRDAAHKLKSPFAVIIYLSEDGQQIGMASYGKTQALCSDAAKFGQYLFEKAKQWGDDVKCPECGSSCVDIHVNWRTGKQCEWVLGRRGWRQLGVYDG